MTWTKKGLVFCPGDRVAGITSGASFPTPLLFPDKIRIYFSSRGENNQSSIFYVDVDRNDPSKVIHASNEPLLSPGKLGTFDDCGAQPMHALRHDGKVYLYYLGWNMPW